MDKNIDKSSEILHNNKLEKDEIRSISNENIDRLKNPDRNVENTVNEIVLSGIERIDYKFIDKGKQDVKVKEIDSPELSSEDFKKRSIQGMEDYILDGGLEESHKYHPISLIKLDNQYYVGKDGHHRVFLAKHMMIEKIPANVKELKILK